MATGVASWSTTASDNATADSTVNWAEGQAPSTVNDSGRAMMTSVAKWRDDIAGTLTTGGTSTAYTLTTNQSFGSLSAMDGNTIRVKFNAANGAAPTLNVDSLGAKAIHTVAGTAVLANRILANSVHDIVYDNSNSAFVLIGSVAEAPAGVINPYGGSSAPAGWLLCNGAAVSRTTYAVLYAVIGTTFGTGDGSTTFNVPDLGGRVVAGKESSATRLTSAGSGVDGATLGATGGSETHTLTEDELASHTHTNSVGTGLDQNYTTANVDGGSLNNKPAILEQSGTELLHNHTVTIDSTGGDAAHNNVQPTIVLNYIIKT